MLYEFESYAWSMLMVWLLDIGESMIFLVLFMRFHEWIVVSIVFLAQARLAEARPSFFRATVTQATNFHFLARCDLA